MSHINSKVFINVDFKGNEIGDDPLCFIFENIAKFNKLIRLKYFNFGLISNEKVLTLMEKFINNNKFIFTIELNIACGPMRQRMSRKWVHCRCDDNSLGE